MTNTRSRPDCPVLPQANPTAHTARQARQGSPRRRVGALVAAAALCLTGFAQVTHAAANPSPGPASGSTAAWDSTPPSGPVKPKETAPWWMAFNDATLNLLVFAAQQRQAGLTSLQMDRTASDSTAGMATEDARRQVVANYLGARVMSARWLALNGLRNAADRQRQLLAATSPGPVTPAAAELKDLIANLQQRSERVAQQQQALAEERESLLQSLGSLCGMSSAQLADLLAPALNQSNIPAFDSAVPARLPRSILRARPDVASAEAAVLRSLRTAGSHQHEVVAQMQQADGWIAAEGDPGAGHNDPAAARKVSLAATPPTPELAELRALMDAATQEVAENLYGLGERARLQSERAQLAESSRVAFFAARDRLKSGEVTELQVLDQYQRLLAESDRYATACGELAMAWLRLVASTGASDQVLVRQGL